MEPKESTKLASYMVLVVEVASKSDRNVKCLC